MPATPIHRSAVSDEQLLLDYRRNLNPDSFQILVGRYERELYGHLRRYLGDSSLAEDVFQATFLKVHLKCDQFRPDLKFRPWLYRIATNGAIDAIRRNRRHRLASLEQGGLHEDDENTPLRDSYPGCVADPADAVERQERKAWVRQAVGQLPDPLRQAVTLVYLDGLRYREAAERLSIPLGTLKSRMHTALAMLGRRCPEAFVPAG